ncbi:unnamed protein product [Caenorhabditis bovis]|uniref:Uncharacterized protein n=1 Tax=Caenorhabditis bovis TaxID=2654633 RepID=A0A8S1F6Y3_9PELO|nr:unnamed protein product [Caenorhabditis bovis]
MRTGGFVQIFKDFSNWSTVAAVPHISNASNKISRVFWIVVFFFVLGMFAYELYILISKYFSYPAIIFPVVTVCNMNAYKYRVVRSNSAFSDLNDLMEAYKNAVGGGLTADKYGLKDVAGDEYDLDSRMADAQLLEAYKIPESDKTAGLYSYSDLIQDCTFSGQPCSESDFTRFVDPVYGACYSFNDNPSLNYSVSRQGILFGLKLMITVTQETTDGVTDFLPNTKLAGVRIGVYARGTKPMLDANGIDVGVGYQSAVSISLVEFLLSKKPYGTCVDREPADTDNYQDFTYTLETCFDGCKQRDTVAKCGCANPRFALGPGDTPCEPTKAALECLESLKGSQTSPTNPNIDLLRECSCHPPCREHTYTPTVSLARFPARGYYVATESSGGVGSCSYKNTKFASRNTCQRWYANNALTLQVFFETLSYELYTEKAGYTVSNIINDLGGQAGLWLGLSLISCIEMGGLLLVTGAFCITGGRIQIVPDADEIEKDHRIKDVEDVKKEIDHMEKRQNSESDDDDEKDEGEAEDKKTQ